MDRKIVALDKLEFVLLFVYFHFLLGEDRNKFDLGNDGKTWRVGFTSGARSPIVKSNIDSAQCIQR